MSIMAVFAGSLFAALDHSSKAPTTLSWVADRLPMLLDQTAFGGFQLGQGRRREAANDKLKSGNQTVAAAVVSPTASDSYGDVNTTGSTRFPDASRSEVAWLFDQKTPQTNPSLKCRGC